MINKSVDSTKLTNFQFGLKILSLLLGVLYLIDSVLGFRVVPFFIDRKALFFTFLLSITLFYFSKSIKFSLSLSSKIIIIFIFFSLFWLFLGVLKYGTKLSHAFADWRPYLTLTLFILVINLKNKSFFKFKDMQKIVVFSTAILMFYMIVFYAFGVYFIEVYGNYKSLTSLLNFLIYPTTYIGLMPDGFFRVLWLSSIWIVLAVFWSEDVIKNHWIRLIFYLICALSLLVTYTRGIWIGISVGILSMLALEYLVNHKNSMKNKFDFKKIEILFIPFIWALVAFFNQNIHDRLIGKAIAIDQSIDIRIASIKALIEHWLLAPILGHGYGAHVPDLIRDVIAPYSYEVVPFALLMKLGIIGFFIFYGFFVTVICTALIKYNHLSMPRFVGAFVAFTIITATNPYLFNLVGMTILGMLLIHWSDIVDGK